MGAVVNIQSSVISWICNIADKTAVSKNVATLRDWENGVRPTLAQVDKMSRQLDVPFGYFFLSTPPDLAQSGSPVFRAVGSKLKDIIRRMQTIQGWLKEEAEDESYKPSPISGILEGNTDTSDASQKLRDILHLDMDWYRQVDGELTYSYLRQKAGENQVFVFESGIDTGRKLEAEEFRAFALYDDQVSLICINADDKPYAKEFSLLHELVHIAIKQDDLMRRGPAEESFCHSVAAKILPPEADFSSRLYAKHAEGNPERVATTASHFDYNFLFMLRASVEEGRTQYTEAYRLIDCWGTAFDRLMMEVDAVV